MRISDWSSDVCSSDLLGTGEGFRGRIRIERPARARRCVEGVDQPEAEPLEPGPGAHRAVVGAQIQRRRGKPHAIFLGQPEEAAAQDLICGSPTCNDQIALLTFFLARSLPGTQNLPSIACSVREYCQT